MEESSDSEVLNAGKCRGSEGMFHDLRSDPRSFIHRGRESLWKPAPQFQSSLHRTSRDIVFWMQKGSPWRAFLLSSVGVVLLLGLAGLATFMLFFLAASLNAVAVGFLASVGLVGVFATAFFTTLTAIYIVTLVVALLTISTITFCCICAALIVAGWIAFLWVAWQGLKKGAGASKGLFKGSGLRRPAVRPNGENSVIPAGCEEVSKCDTNRCTA